MSTAKRATHPYEFDEFYAKFLEFLSAADRPTGFVAYCRTEAEVVRLCGQKRYANYKVWRNTMSRYHQKSKKSKNDIKIN